VRTEKNTQKNLSPTEKCEIPVVVQFVVILIHFFLFICESLRSANAIRSNCLFLLVIPRLVDDEREL